SERKPLFSAGHFPSALFREGFASWLWPRQSLNKGHRIGMHTRTAIIDQKLVGESRRMRSAAAQVVVCFAQPVSTRRCEDVEINRVRHGGSFVRHMRRDAKHFAGGNNDFFAVNFELKGAF